MITVKTCINKNKNCSKKNTKKQIASKLQYTLLLTGQIWRNPAVGYTLKNAGLF